MTQERAKEIIANRGPYGELRYAFKLKFTPSNQEIHANGITENEDEYIRKAWKKLPGWTSFMTVLQFIANGKINKFS